MELTAPTLTIDDFGQPHDRQAFERLNRDWLEESFYVEPEDERLFADPENLILKSGGHILMARLDGKTIGTCALMTIDDGVYEFAKMAVDKSVQGQGIGRRMLEAAIQKARAAGASKILICTSSKLTAANALYHKLGFVDSHDPRHHAYDRADVFLELAL